MANLPNNTFLCNYNAKEYNPATHSIPKTAGQLFNEDLVLDSAPASYTNTSISLNGQYMHYDFGNSSNNIFNRSGNDPLTIVAKVSKGLDPSGEHCIFSVRDGGTINYLLFNPANGCDNTIVFLHNTNRYYSNTPYVQFDADPNIFAIRVDGGNGYGQSFTDEETFRSISNSWGGGASSIGFFKDSYTTGAFESWRGDFYWLYIANQALTTAEIEQVIAYNEAASTLEVTPTAITASSAASSYTLSVSADTAVTWTASTTDAWFTLNPTTGTGNGTITVSVPEATFSARTGEITVTSSDAGEIPITVSQPKGPFILTRKDLYRNGNVIKKMYRSGNLIYLRLNPPTP